MNQPTTVILQRLAEGDKDAVHDLLPRVYAELKQIANRYLSRENTPDVLQSTALVHEAFLRLFEEPAMKWQRRSHFLAVASTVMRRILIDHARQRRAAKRDGRPVPAHTQTLIDLDESRPVDVLVLDELLTRLEQLNARHAQVVELRVFGGLTVIETAKLLEVSPATVKNDWRAARAWLSVELQDGI